MQLEHQRHRHRPRAVGNDDEHAPSVDRQAREPLARDGIDLLGRQIPLADALADDIHFRNSIIEYVPGRHKPPSVSRAIRLRFHLAPCRSSSSARDTHAEATSSTTRERLRFALSAVMSSRLRLAAEDACFCEPARRCGKPHLSPCDRVRNASRSAQLAAVPPLAMRFPATEYVASLAMVRASRRLPPPTPASGQ